MFVADAGELQHLGIREPGVYDRFGLLQRPLWGRPEKVFFAKSMPSVETKFMGLPLSEGSNTQLNPDTSVSFRDGEVPYIR